jgi:Tfp pilus assembly protein PilX
MFRKKRYRKKYKGIALVMAMLFVMVFSALSVAMFSMSSGNAIVATNLHTVNEARSAAESGLEVLRYYINQVAIDGLTPESARFDVLGSQIETLMNADSSGMATFDDTVDTIYIGSINTPVNLNSTDDNHFYAQITPNSTEGALVSIIGEAGQVDRTISGGFSYGVRKNSVFDYGVASKGAVETSSIDLDGLTVRVEADMYIESMTTAQALYLKNSSIAGDVKIVNPDAYVTMSGASSIGGEGGIDAIVNHVEVGVEPTEFPEPNPSHFEQYVNGPTIDSNNLATYTSSATLDNVRIAAGTNPTFDGNTTINGVLYVEQPNVVTIKGGATINGVIIGNGDVTDNSGTNQFIFEGGVTSSSVASLDRATYGDLVDETGTFLMAPGFSVSMGGNFGTLNGCIACNGFTTYGNASGTIGGSIINYSPEVMHLGGDDLFFNRSGITELPAGFVPEVVVYYDPSAYDEII